MQNQLPQLSMHKLVILIIVLLLFYKSNIFILSIEENWRQVLNKFYLFKFLEIHNIVMWQ